MPKYYPSTISETPKSKRSYVQKASWETFHSGFHSGTTQPNGKENHPPASPGHPHSKSDKPSYLQVTSWLATNLLQEHAMWIKAEAAVSEADKAAEASELKKKTFQRLFNNMKKKLTCAAASKKKLQVELKSIRAVSTREA